MAASNTGGLSGIRRALQDGKARQAQAEAARRDRITPVERGGKLAVAEQQRYLWFLYQLAPESPTYNEPFTVRLRGELDLDALRSTLRTLVARHEAMRTRFGHDEGVPYQVIDPALAEWPLPVVDAAEETAQAWIDAEAAAPFDLFNGPVFRSSVLRIAPDDHVLILVWHHIVSDGWSVRLISDELSTLYAAARHGNAPASLPAIDLQQADFAAWQRNWLQGEEMARQVDFWRKALDGVEPLDLPADHPRPPQPTGAGAIHQSALPAELSRGLREFATAEGVSLFSVLLAGFETVLHRYTGQQDLAFGTLLPGRSRSQVESMIGYFANAAVFRGDFTGEPTFRTLIQRCDETLLEAIAHQDAPFGALVEAIKPEREAGRSPLFQHLFTLLPAGMAPRFELADLDVELLAPILGTSRFDLSIQITDEPEGGLGVWVEFSTELFDRDRIERLVDHLTTVLTSALADPGSRADSLELLPPVELALVVDGWNPAPVERPEGLLHELVARQVEAAPEHVAMRFQGTDLTYQDLDVRANRLAHLLVDEHQAGPGQIVGVLLERGLDLPVAELAILKTGAAWLPLDPQYPPDRLAYQLGDAGVRVLLTTSDLAPNAPTDISCVLLDSDALDHYTDTPPQVQIHPEDAAYVIYTSGSTGRPKGVMVPHRAATHFCHNLTELFDLGPNDRVLQLANPAFDVSVSDFFATLAAGATIIGAPRSILFNPDTLQTLLAEEHVTFGDIPPAVLRLLDPKPLTSLRILFIGMEPFGPELVNTWAAPGRQFHNGYGPTEVTITCVDYQCPDQPLTQAPPIGQAMNNHRAYILDTNLNPTPIGIPGQLYMAGAGLAHGYLQRPDLTADKFLPDPHTTQPGQRMYATGDMVTWQPDGNIQFLGRIDRQVKIHGLRIELGEIEHALDTHQDVRHSAVTAIDPGTAQARLVAYVVANSGATIDTDSLRSHMADQLPLHMVPASIITIAELPLTANGKLDTARLPAPESQNVADRTPPETETELRLAEIWHKLLSVETAQISTSDDFFSLGGNSLQVIQLISRIRDAFQTTVEARQILTHPQLRQLAAYIEQTRSTAIQPQESHDESAARADVSTVQLPRQTQLPSSHLQEGLWLLHELDPDSSDHGRSYAARIKGTLDTDALSSALTALVGRHEALRTRFEDADGSPVQTIDPAPTTWPVRATNLADETKVSEWIRREAEEPFDLQAGPVFRASTAAISPDDHVLLLTSHRIVADSQSLELVFEELCDLYNSARSGESLSHAPLARQRNEASVGTLDQQMDHWVQTLAGVEPLQFPSDRPRNPQSVGGTDLYTRQLPELTPALNDLARTEHSSLLAVLLAGYFTVLHRYTGQEDFAVGSEFAGRDSAEVENVVGAFANTLALRADLAGEPTFRALIRRCDTTLRGAGEHSDIPVGLLLAGLSPERAPGSNPLFQTTFSLEPTQRATAATTAATAAATAAASAALRLGDALVSPITTTPDLDQFDLAVTIRDSADGALDFTVRYSTELFDADRMKRLADHFGNVLTAALAAPDSPLDALNLLTPAETETMLTQWNPLPTPRPGGLLHEFAAHWATVAPDRVASRFDGAELTYGDLDTSANRLAHVLIEDHGIRSGNVVGVLLERGLNLPIVSAAVLKAGGTWMPLDPQHPAKRLAYQLSDSQAPVVITTTDLADLLPAALPRIYLDDPATRDRVNQAPNTAPAIEIRPGDVAYVMYTSGSTGAPKGVMVPHSAAVQYAHSTVELFSISWDDRFSLVANPSFDVSIFDNYTAFAAGATTIGAPQSTLLDPDALGRMLRDERVTVSYVPPALLGLVDPDVPRDLRVMIVIGEACPADLPNRWSRPGREFHNGYGPTEATVTCTNYLCPVGPMDAAPPIGPPMANHRAYVLDKQLRLAPMGVPGQLYMAGAGLARGYLGRPDLTAEKFLPDPFNPEPGQRMYATGDLVRWGSDGNLHYLGRVDRQVKIRGLRIELGEIEHELAAAPDVRQSAVVVQDANTPRARIIGYVVPEPGRVIDTDKVIERLTEQLPVYMLPSTLISLPELPLTANGKLDRTRLPEPDPQAGQRGNAEHLPPETGTQRRVAEIWRGLLELGDLPIGRHDSFTAVGGDSLRGIQLITRIREGFGVTLHPRDLGDHATLAELAALIDSRINASRADAPAPAPAAAPASAVAPSPAAEPATALVPLQPNGTRTPLFFVHAVGGTVTPYAALVPLLGPDQPFYGLEHPGSASAQADRSISEIAADYLTEIRAAQPAGPYRFGGWSLGGVIALEMATQLQAVGEQADLVVMLDSGYPAAQEVMDQAQLLAWFAEDISGLAFAGPDDDDADGGDDETGAVDPVALRRIPQDQQVDAFLESLGALDSADEDGFADELRERFKVFSANSLAFSAHEPSPYRGRLVFLRAEDQPLDGDADRWRELAGPGFEELAVPGNHYTVLQPQNIKAVADALRRCLADSERRAA